MRIEMPGLPRPWPQKSIVGAKIWVLDRESCFLFFVDQQQYGAFRVGNDDTVQMATQRRGLIISCSVLSVVVHFLMPMIHTVYSYYVSSFLWFSRFCGLLTRINERTLLYVFSQAITECFVRNRYNTARTFTYAPYQPKLFGEGLVQTNSIPFPRDWRAPSAWVCLLLQGIRTWITFRICMAK